MIKGRWVLDVAIEPNRATRSYLGIERTCSCLAPTAEYSTVSWPFLVGGEGAIAVAFQVEDMWV